MYVTTKIKSFREIIVSDEEATLLPDGVTWAVTYGGLNVGFPFVLKLNNKILTPVTDFIVSNASMGYFQLVGHTVSRYSDGRAQDRLSVSYQFDYFPIQILEGMIRTGVDMLNYAGPSQTAYSIDTIPSNLYGIVADYAVVGCVEKLILDYDLWKGRLIFAIGPEAIDSGSTDIVAQLESLKTSTNERINSVIQNPRFKIANHVSSPTQAYWQAIGRGPNRANRNRGQTVNRFY